MQNKRRTEVATGSSSLGVSFIDMAFEHGTAVNIHGFRCSVAIEPEDADANANGIMAVYVLPGELIQNSDLPQNFGAFGNEDVAPYLWGMIPWACSNQTPFLWEFAPKTSRNMQRGGRIVLDIRFNGISAGLVRQNTMLTCFTSDVK